MGVHGVTGPKRSGDNLSQRIYFLKEGVHADDPLKLRSYWTEVHQIYKQCSQIIEDELFKIRMAILQSVSECQGYE